MKLYIMRHGRALTLEESQVKYDAERPLSGPGELDILAVSDFMKALNLRPDAIFSGPFKRSMQSAEIVASAMGSMDVKLDTGLLPGSGINEVLECISKVDGDDEKTVMVVLHEPDMSLVIGNFLSDQDRVGSYPYPVYCGDFVALRVDIQPNKISARTMNAFSPMITRCNRV